MSLVGRLLPEVEPPLVTLLGGWRATGFAALFVVSTVALGATALVQSWRLSNAQAEIDANKVTITNFGTAQKSQLSTIEDLREANKAWALKCALDPAATAKAAADTAQDSGALPADDKRRSQERDRLNENPGVAEWGRVVVPHDVQRWLRE